MSDETISIKVNIDNIIKLIDILRKTPRYLKKFQSDMNNSNLNTPLQEGKRSLKGDIMHIIHSDQEASRRIYAARMLDEPDLKKINPDDNWADVLMLEKLRVEELITYFTIKRKMLMEFLHSLDMKTWVLKFTLEGNKKPMNIYKEARSMALHEQKHLKITNTRIKRFMN